MIPEQDLLRLHTSGSIAFPLHVVHDRRALLQTIAHSERDRAVEAALCGKRHRYVVAEIWAGGAPVPKVQSFFGPRATGRSVPASTGSRSRHACRRWSAVSTSSTPMSSRAAARRRRRERV